MENDGRVSHIHGERGDAILHASDSRDVLIFLYVEGRAFSLLFSITLHYSLLLKTLLELFNTNLYKLSLS